MFYSDAGFGSVQAARLVHWPGLAASSADGLTRYGSSVRTCLAMACIKYVQ